MKDDLITQLQKRGIVNNITNLEKINYALEHHKGVYIGFDPSASSLHLGNYAAIVLLRRFKKYGLRTFALVGGATGMIGDPSGKSSERQLLDMQIVQKNKEAIKKQLLTYAHVEQIIDNYDFYKEMNFLNFLRDIGKYINVTYMIDKEIVKTRLDVGISYTEFSYSLIQANDFLNLYKNYDVCLQAGGSDQWGNITTGCELIRKVVGDQNYACGLTINLLLKSDGKKFGKSEKGAIFLDPNLTSAYEMYQFLINQEDQDVVRLLKFLTEIDLDEIDQIEASIKTDAKQKLGQKLLAKTIVSDIHGIQGYESALKISNILFSNENPQTLTLDELNTIYKVAPHIDLKIQTYSLLELLKVCNIASSNREAREFISQNAISINGIKYNDENLEINSSFYLQNMYTIIKKGKRYNYIIKWTK